MARIPELLAPAGNLSCLKAAVAAGCDAVYFGGQAFNARKGAGNLTKEEIREAVAFCGIHGVKPYLTLNTMVKQGEWPSLRLYLEEALSTGISAVIVQDLGVAELVKRMFPEMELHGSTQMTVHDAAGVHFLEELGFKRVVLARELSLKEIQAIRHETEAELEVFIHGALCCSYSGRCLLSSFHGGRSGNRGTCAQPCRLPYKIQGRESYPMNLKDLCGAGQLQALLDAGVDSFKMEGRMKGIPYVAGMTQIYRELIDGWKDSGQVPELTEEKKNQMLQLYNRGAFTEGYLTNDKKDMIARCSPKHQGVLLGRVERVNGSEVILELSRRAAPGDVLEIHTEHLPYPALRLSAGMIRDRQVRFRTKQKLQKDQKVYRLVDTALNERLQHEIGVTEPVPVQIEAEVHISRPIQLKGRCRNVTVQVKGPVVQPAEKRGITEEEIRRQLGRLGETEFVARTIEVILDEGCFMPVSLLNQLRRELIGQLREKLIPKGLSPRKEEGESPSLGENGQIHLGVWSKAQWEAALEGPVSLHAIYPGLFIPEKELIRKSREKGIRIIPQCPPVSRMKEDQAIQKAWREWSLYGITEFEAQHLGQVQEIKEKGFECWAGFGLAVMNRAGAAFWQKRAKGFFISSELTEKETQALTGLNGASVLIYGKIPLMVTEQCFYREQKGCRTDPEGHRLFLQDRYGGQLMAFSHCEACYSVLYENTPLWLGDQLLEGVHRRLEFADETPEEVVGVLEALKRRQSLKLYHRGHWNKGVL